MGPISPCSRAAFGRVSNLMAEVSTFLSSSQGPGTAKGSYSRLPSSINRAPPSCIITTQSPQRRLSFFARTFLMPELLHSKIPDRKIVEWICGLRRSNGILARAPGLLTGECTRLVSCRIYGALVCGMVTSCSREGLLLAMCGIRACSQGSGIRQRVSCRRGSTRASLWRSPCARLKTRPGHETAPFD